MSKKYFNQNSVAHNREAKKGRDSSPAPAGKPVPTFHDICLADVIDEKTFKETFAEGDAFSKFIGMDLFAQMARFVISQDGLNAKTVNERKDMENSLYNIVWGGGCGVVTADNTIAEYELYMVDRSVRIDRDTHKLNRASCTIVAMGRETHTIQYTVTAYLTSRYTGTVMVIPVGDTGPQYKSSVRYNFNMSDRAQ